MRPGDLPRLRAALIALTAAGPPVRRVLEVGCGSFASAPLLSEQFPAAVVCGLDRDWDALRRASRSGVVVADGAALPFGRASGFDLIVVRHPDVDRRPRGWQALGRALSVVLDEQGRVLVSGYSRHEPEFLATALIQGGLTAFPLDQKILPPADLSGQDRFVIGLARPEVARTSAPTPVESPVSCYSSP